LDLAPHHVTTEGKAYHAGSCAEQTRVRIGIPRTRSPLLACESCGIAEQERKRNARDVPPKTSSSGGPLSLAPSLRPSTPNRGRIPARPRVVGCHGGHGRVGREQRRAGARQDSAALHCRTSTAQPPARTPSFQHLLRQQATVQGSAAHGLSAELTLSPTASARPHPSPFASPRALHTERQCAHARSKQRSTPCGRPARQR
jgi:hypothetical protein